MVEHPMTHGSRETGGTEHRARIQGFTYKVVVTVSAIGVFITINQLFNLQVGGFLPIGTAYYYYILATFLALTYLIFPARKKDEKHLPWYDWLLFAICIAINLYLAVNAYNILTKGWEYQAPSLPTAASFVLWFLALEGVRRAGGNSLCIICGFFSFYPLFGQYLPSIFWGSPFSLTQTACYHGMGVESIIGIPTRVVGDLLVGFIIFGVALVSSGGGKFFMDFAMSLLGDKRGGAAKVSVLSSAFMASLSGSVISNIVTTGSMTIPAMKRTGYSPRYAAAVEACASTGGSIMPPIMGAAGFLIASFLTVPYSKVMWAAFFPAVLYYWTLLLQVDFHAAKEGIGGLPREELPKIWATLKEGWFFFGSILLLVFMLVYMRSEALAPFYTILFLFAAAMLRRSTRYNFKKFLHFLYETGKLLSQITAILAGVGLIVGSLSGTGVANAFSREIIMLAGKNYIMLLILGAVTSFVLGIGMTVTACYVFLAIVLVPALVEVGLDPMACHLFVLYWGCLSYITPPVALGSITAAALADADPMATGWLSMKLGSAKYIVPFFFALNPALIMAGPLWVVLQAVVTAIAGCIFLAASLEGWLFYYGKISAFQRIHLFITGFLLMYPGWQAALIGMALLAAFFIVVKMSASAKEARQSA
jgi:TRAP transporter 4TM/12TM fusion protein